MASQYRPEDKPEIQSSSANCNEYLVASLLTVKSGEYQRYIVASSPMTAMDADIYDFESKAFMSWDGLVSPISMDGHAGMPRYATPLIGSIQTTHPKSTLPPIDKQGEAGQFNQYNLNIDIDYMNPFSNPTEDTSGNPLTRSAVASGRTDTPTIGHHVDIIGRVTPASSVVMPIQGALDGTVGDSDYQNDYAAFALRGPLIIGGWGHDTNGFPIPNKADVSGNAFGGIFTEENLQHKFMDNFLRNPGTWPVGPVDLRWDRARACWVSPPPFRFVRGTLQENVPVGGSGLVSLTNYPTLYDSSGTIITDPEFYVNDWHGEPLVSGAQILANYDTHNGVYHTLAVSPSLRNVSGCRQDPFDNGSGSLIAFSNLNIGSGLYASTIDGQPTLHSCISVYVGGSGGGTSLLTNLVFEGGLSGNISGCTTRVGLNIVASGTDFCHENWLPGSSVPNAASGTESFNKIEVQRGLLVTQVPGSERINLGLDIEVSGTDSNLASTHFHGAKGFQFGSGITVGDSGCLIPIGLFYPNSEGSQVIITGVTCSGSSLVVGSGELVWKYGLISGVRAI